MKTIYETSMGLTNSCSYRRVTNREFKMKNGSVLAASFKCLGGSCIFLKVVACSSSS